MKTRIKISFLLIIMAAYSLSYAQMDKYDYKRKLQGISNQWHKIIMPNELFAKTSQNLTDMRIFGLTAGNDTIEVPYILRLTTEKISSKEVAFRTINVSHNSKGYYFTFEIPTKEPINEMKLDFSKVNFDWRITLEGSHNQKEWFTIIRNYRILSIKNKQTDFKFTKLSFPSSKYRFFRLLINSKVKPRLKVASVTQHEITAGSLRTYKIKEINTKHHKQTKQTEVDVELQEPLRISRIKVAVSNAFDYYRPITIKYLTDSIKTEQGWRYNYSTLAYGTLNSLEKNEFKFPSTTAKKLKLFINNQDNQPLTIDTIEVRGYIYELLARFTNQADYYLTYGNRNDSKPNYDIKRFTDYIPKTMTTLKLGDELKIEKSETAPTTPLFKNKTWLWAVMTLIILLLGWFSIKMIRKD